MCDEHENHLLDHLISMGNAWIEPRYLFDTAVAYLSDQHIAIPKYSIMQRLVSVSMRHVKKDIESTLQQYLEPDLKRFLNAVIANEDALKLHHLKDSARSFTPAELKKERIVYQQLSPYEQQIKKIVNWHQYVANPFALNGATKLAANGAT
jgi:hypothetical protein